MARQESDFIKAREAFENRIDQIRAALLSKLEDDLAGDAEEADVSAAQDELADFDDFTISLSEILDKVQDEIGRLE